MVFPLEKILPSGITFEDYWASVEKDKSMHTLMGIHIAGNFRSKKDMIIILRENVPKNVEVVLGYTEIVAFGQKRMDCPDIVYAPGIALIPKEKREKRGQ